MVAIIFGTGGYMEAVEAWRRSFSLSWASLISMSIGVCLKEGERREERGWLLYIPLSSDVGHTDRRGFFEEAKGFTLGVKGQSVAVAVL